MAEEEFRPQGGRSILVETPGVQLQGIFDHLVFVPSSQPVVLSAMQGFEIFCEEAYDSTQLGDIIISTVS
jgi:hypothetical protein